MNKETFNKIIKLSEKQGVDLEKFIKLYPHFTKRLISVKSAGISKRNFSHWKKEGLIKPLGAERSWNKLNLIEFLWLRIIQILREFGVPFSGVKALQDLLFIDVYAQMKKLDRTEIINALKNHGKLSEEDINLQIESMTLVSTLDPAILDAEAAVYRTFLCSFLSYCLLQGDLSLILYREENNFHAA